jgi:hypothetical protein
MLMKIEVNLDKNKYQEYARWAKDEAVPYFLSVPGLKEMRAYREPGSLRALLEYEFESFTAFGRMMDDSKYKAMLMRIASYTSGLEVSLWDVSPLMPEPVRPKK